MGKNNSTSGLTWKHKIGYGCGDAGGVMTLVLVSSYMTRYITNVLGVDYAVLSAMLLVWNIWDAVNDPLMGTLMDKSFQKAKDKTNKFRPWIRHSIPVVAIGLVAFYGVPSIVGGNPWLIVASLFVLKVVYELGYTMLNIAMGSMLGVMSTNDGERATLASARGFGSTVGGLLGTMMVPRILASLGETKQGYFVAAVATAILATVIIFMHYKWTEERNVAAQQESANGEEEKIKFTDILDVFKKNRAYVALCVHSIFIVCATTVYNQASTYMYADVFGDIGLGSIASPFSMILQIVALSFAPTLAKKFGLVKIIRTCLLGGIALFIALFVVMTMMDIPAIVFVLWSGVAFAGLNLSVQMQWGLVGESIDYNEYLTGKRTEGSIYGVFSLTRRIGTTIASSLAVLMIGWVGYDQAAANAGLAQSAEAVKGLTVMGVLIPAILAIGSWVAFTFIWNINDDTRAKMAAWRESKKAEENRQ